MEWWKSMLNILTYISLISILSCFFLFLSSLSYRTTTDLSKCRPFECGFDASRDSRLPFCMKFFLVGVIFLIFDVEVRLLTPLPYAQSFLLFFIVLLIIGLVYEWYYGGLEWLAYVNRNCARYSRSFIKGELENNLINIGSESHIIPSINFILMDG